jgi:hypothetical protein
MERTRSQKQSQGSFFYLVLICLRLFISIAVQSSLMTQCRVDDRVFGCYRHSPYIQTEAPGSRTDAIVSILNAHSKLSYWKCDSDPNYLRDASFSNRYSYNDWLSRKHNLLGIVGLLFWIPLTRWNAGLLHLKEQRGALIDCVKFHSSSSANRMPRGSDIRGA